MANGQSDYQVGPGKPPLHTRFKKRQSGNPRGRSPKNLPAVLADALNERFWVTIASRLVILRRFPSIVTQNRSLSASASTAGRFFGLRPRGLPDWRFLKRVCSGGLPGPTW